MRAVKQQFALLIALLTGSALAQQAPNLTQIVSHMEEARIRAKQTEPFLLTREYRMFHGDDARPTSEVKAEISVVPPAERDYKIVSSKGSDRGEKVVRKILDHEAAAEKSTPPPTAIVHQNYDFGFEGEARFQGARCYVLLLKPRRKDPALIEGHAWVDANTYLIRKIEGRMSKSPSWWVKDVQLTVLFGEIGGIWTQLSSDAVANVRILGRYYVTGKATNLQTATTAARNHVPVKITVFSAQRPLR